MTGALSPQYERAGGDEYALPMPAHRRIRDAIFGFVGSAPQRFAQHLLYQKLGSRSSLSRARDCGPGPEAGSEDWGGFTCIGARTWRSRPRTDVIARRAE